MNNQKLIIYDFTILFKILSEVEGNLNFKIIQLNKDELVLNNNEKYKNTIFLTKKKNPNIENQFILNNLPISLKRLVESINIFFLKINYQDKSNLQISNYMINLNSKNISFNNNSLKLTEKEISTIMYLSKLNKPVSIKELQLNVWDHKLILETHTVETHIHRLRKKIREKFNDNSFIKSTKEGYLIN
tara:strand:+ start:9245 stop:9808 length:564 start_codon:yes stop_codon:yes gene_type:complete